MTPPQAVTNSVNASAPQSARPTAQRSDVRMPHVFVIPPVEEQQENPPWCCFDADEPEHAGDVPSNSDIHSLDIPCLLQRPNHDRPPLTPRRASVLQPRPKIPITRKLEKRQRPEAVKIIENKQYLGRRDAREDSDVIEVVKLKRAREPPADIEANTKVKRSKTLRVRATEALRSIKNVGKGSNKAHVKNLWTPTESIKGMQEHIRSQQDRTECRSPTTPTKKSTLSRAASRSLSQIFHPVKHSPPQSSFTVRVPSSVVTIEAHHITPTPNSPFVSHLNYNDKSSLVEVPGSLMTEDALCDPIPQSPTIKKKHLNAKFSVKELHRLFTFTSSSPDDPSAPGGPNSSSSSSTLPSNCPDVPMGDDIFADACILDLDSPERKLASRYYQPSRIHRNEYLSTPARLRDLSFEMKLNSLHFDTLSFDPEDFDTSMEGDILR